MAFKTFADGVALPASDLNTYLMKQAVIVCTSGTRPSSPSEGMTIYETDTDRLLTYTTATTGWQQPWNMPWGQLAYEETTTQQGGITTLVNLTSLSTAVTLVANRRIKVTGHVPFFGNTADDYFAAYVVQGSTNIAIARGNVGATPANGLALDPVGVFTSSAGAVAIGLSAARTNGTGNGQTFAEATNPCYLLVEDIGPAAAPA